MSQPYVPHADPRTSASRRYDTLRRFIPSDEHDTMSVVFDFGDLDQPIVELDSDGCGRRVFRPP
jgi:hypothetical protein